VAGWFKKGAIVPVLGGYAMVSTVGFIEMDM
jgi:hypothetical protein